MNQRIQRFTRKLRMLERQRYQLAHSLDRAERQGNVSSLVMLEEQYREIVEAMGRLRNVLRRLASPRRTTAK